MSEPTIKQTAPFTVAFKVVKGEFDQIPGAFYELYQWVEHYGLQPVGDPLALFLTVPENTPAQLAEWEVWAPIAGGAGETGPDDAGYGVKRIEPETMASCTYIGPYTKIAPTYERLESWIAEEGYTVVGPPREIYQSDPAEAKPEEYVTEVQMPVARV